MGTTNDIIPMDNSQGEEQSPEDEDIKRDYLQLDEEMHPQVTPGDDEYPPSQYHWDDEDNDTGSSFRVNALSTPTMGYCKRKGNAVMHDKQVQITTCGPNYKLSNNICLQAGVTTGNSPSLYDHCMRKCMGTRPTWSHE